MSRPSLPSEDVVVVGAGILGAAVAHELSTSGRRVLLVDRHAPGGGHAASGDTTRILRSGYGAASAYTASARDARTRWRAFESTVGERLLIESGVLWFARTRDGFEAQSETELRRQGIPVERLAPAEAAARFPGMSADDLAFAVHEPEAGVLLARDCVRALVGAAVEAGARFTTGDAVPDGEAMLLDGEPIRARNLVWATGAWLSGQFPLVATRVTRQDTVSVGCTAAWNIGEVPAWIDPSAAFYGTGGLHGDFKVASSTEGPEFELGGDRPRPDPLARAHARGYADHRFPGLAPTAVSALRHCHYALTPDHGFIVAHHPRHPAVLLVGGDSGHAFKHALGLAEHVARILAGRDRCRPAFGLEPRSPARGLRVSAGTTTLPSALPLPKEPA